MIPDRYRTDHLLLLIGTNPLPNLVAAEVLLKPSGTLHMVCSEGTCGVAKRLAEHFQKKGSSVKIEEKLTVEAMDAHNIGAAIERRLGRLTGTVGLNYTGGTKTMAVHAYRAVEHLLSSRQPAPVFSYLDKDTFRMRFDPDMAERVLFEVQPTLDELAALHGSVFQLAPKRKPSDLVMPDVAAALARSARSGGLDAWRTWCDVVLRAQAHNGRDWRKKAELLQLQLSLPVESALEEALSTLRSSLGLAPASAVLSLDPAMLPGWPFAKRDPEKLCDWLDGDWLEQYVLAQIHAIKDAARLTDWGMTLKTDNAQSDFDFEFDVAAMRGYQFFGISCTTSNDKHLTKSKMFEAFIRARQLGGDEARVALVCGYEGAHRYAHEVLREHFGQSMVRIFGPQELSDLAELLCLWFETAQ